ncbi:MAG: isopentenyl-diphosphate Delta-isomerase [Deltaproteobacteria bacterium]|nr:isopentenyl-diphosphate Delta-isomerase [Deltaproteobacteria bacterium]
MSSNAIVSFDDEPLILVDATDTEIGFAKKQECHAANGILHRAFSVFLINDDNQVLLQQRSEQKSLWPLFWSNACCSHPRRGEDLTQAVVRRLSEELGVNASVNYLFKFQYQAYFKNIGAENELCHVFIGCLNKAISPNKNEIAATRWILADKLDGELLENNINYTPWIKLEWQRIRGEFGGNLQLLAG